MLFRNQKLLLFVFIVKSILSTTAYAMEQNIEIQTNWDSKKNVCIPCDIDGTANIVYSVRTVDLKLKGRHFFDYQILNPQYEVITLPAYYSAELLPSQPDILVEFSKSQGDNFVVTNFKPMIYLNGEVQILRSFTIHITSTPDYTPTTRATTFAASSVLASGSWYKIGVSATGLHKIDAAFLTSLGVSTSGLNPLHINIYGNHFPKLPTENNTYRPDDLLKNSIYIEGEGDGSFDASDYILFYATGPDVVKTGASDFDASKNKIDSLSYYFIHIDASDSPKRIGSTSNSVSSVTHSVTTCNDYYLHELNEVNLLKSGDGWLGEHFDIELTKSFTADLGSVVSGTDITMKTAVGSNVVSGTGSLQVLVNGVQRDLIACPQLFGSYVEAKWTSSTSTFQSNTPTLNFTLNFSRSSAASQAWLDYILLNYQRNLAVGSKQFLIRNMASVGAGNTCQYSVSGATGALQIWEVTDPSNASKITGSLSGSTFTFSQNSDSLRTYVCATVSQAFTPVAVGSVVNQNLHALENVDYIIVTHSSLLAQADRLANLHRNQGTSVHVIEIQKVYNEFGGGAADPVAVRWFMKMFYDRAAGDPALMPKNLCLFGDGTYDPLNRLDGNNYLMPTYNSIESGDIEYISSYTADDFFGFLDDNEGMSAFNLLDIGIGRIPVSTDEEAQKVVDKIEHYMNFGSYLYSNTTGVQCDSDGYSSTFGDWRTRIVLMADDEDGGQFINDCEALSDTVRKYYPEMNVVKIYLDAYQQIVTSGGQRYPDAEEAINQNMNKGALIFNYVGHGGETGLSLERVVTIPMIQNWTNINNLTLFISATCEFSRFDDPGRVSAGETTLITPFGGAVSLMTTTRLVLVTVNSILVKNLYTVLFSEVDGKPLSLGEILRQTKNLTAGSDNVRNFALLGDPALVLGKPQPLIVTDSINGVSVLSSPDTLKSLSKITVSGHVTDKDGNLLSNYDGIVFPTVYDKYKTKYTLGQDPNSPVMSFQSQNNIIYKGKATVTDGYFTFSFVVPKDIDYNLGKGKISYYSHDQNSNNYGYDTTIIVGGVDPNGINDVLGPQIDLYMNDENFASGGVTNTRPLFIAQVNDDNGINTTGNGIGHDITLILDGNTSSPIVLNNFYEADLDTYQSGKVTYQFSELEPGEHQITFKVWDVNNNSSEQTLEFVVVNEEELGVTHLLNYPNPFTTHTEFFFEHNQCCSALEVRIEIFTVSGKLVKTIFDNVNTIAFRSEGIAWDGRDDFGDKLARGVYIYRLTVKTPEGLKAEKIEKLVIL
jgi:hypothetical protein